MAGGEFVDDFLELLHEDARCSLQLGGAEPGRNSRMSEMFEKLVADLEVN